MIVTDCRWFACQTILACSDRQMHFSFDGRGPFWACFKDICPPTAQIEPLSYPLLWSLDTRHSMLVLMPMRCP